jgi:hypothetical protein
MRCWKKSCAAFERGGKVLLYVGQAWFIFAVRTDVETR